MHRQVTTRADRKKGDPITRLASLFAVEPIKNYRYWLNRLVSRDKFKIFNVYVDALFIISHLVLLRVLFLNCTLVWYLKFSVTDLYGRFVAKNIGISGKYSKIGRWEFLGFLTTPLWVTKAKAVGYPGSSFCQNAWKREGARKYLGWCLWC